MDKGTAVAQRTELVGHVERSALRLIVGVASIITASFIMVDTALQALRVHAYVVDVLIEAAVLSIFSCAALWYLVVQPLRQDALRERDEQ